MLQDQGKLSEALDEFRRTPGDPHPEMLTCINNLAALFLEQGKLGEAGLLFRGFLNGHHASWLARTPKAERRGWGVI